MANKNNNKAERKTADEIKQEMERNNYYWSSTRANGRECGRNEYRSQCPSCGGNLHITVSGNDVLMFCNDCNCGTTDVIKYFFPIEFKETFSITSQHHYKDFNGNYVITKEKVKDNSNNGKLFFWKIYKNYPNCSKDYQTVKFKDYNKKFSNIYNLNLLNNFTGSNIFIVEGEKDADSLNDLFQKLNLNNIAITTAFSGIQAKGFSFSVSVLNNLKKYRGKYIVIPDNDLVGYNYADKWQFLNPIVLDLPKLWEQVFKETAPGKVDITDYLEKSREKKEVNFNLILNEIKRAFEIGIDDYNKNYLERLEKMQAENDKKVKNKIVNFNGNSRTSQVNNSDSESIELPKKSDICGWADLFLQKYKQVTEFIKAPERIIGSSCQTLILKGGELFIKEGNLIKLINVENLTQPITNFDVKLNPKPLLKQKVVKEIAEECCALINSNYIEKTIIPEVNISLINVQRFVNFNNGIYDIEKDVFYGTDVINNYPEISNLLFTYKRKEDFVIQSLKVKDDLLEYVFCNQLEIVNALYAWLGIIIANITKKKFRNKFLILFGEGGTGKTNLLELMDKFASSSGSFTLNDYNVERDNKSYATCITKRLIKIDEFKGVISKAIAEFLKKLTGNLKGSVNQKNEKEYEAILNNVIVMACNTKLKHYDKSEKDEALYRRIFALRLQDKTATDRLYSIKTEYCDGIDAIYEKQWSLMVVKAMKALHELWKLDFDFDAYLKNNTEELVKTLEVSNSFEEFLNEKCEFVMANNQATPRSLINKEYAKYCKLNNLQEESKSKKEKFLNETFDEVDVVSISKGRKGYVIVKDGNKVYLALKQAPEVKQPESNPGGDNSKELPKLFVVKTTIKEGNKVLLLKTETGEEIEVILAKEGNSAKRIDNKGNYKPNFNNKTARVLKAMKTLEEHVAELKNRFSEPSYKQVVEATANLADAEINNLLEITDENVIPNWHHWILLREWIKRQQAILSFN